MQPIRPPSKVLLDRMARLHSMPPSGMTGEQARAQVALHLEEAMEEMKKSPMNNKYRFCIRMFAGYENSDSARHATPASGSEPGRAFYLSRP
jgi:hypothetical protein